MPELPEVETTLRGIRPCIEKQIIRQCISRRAKLRWPVPVDALQRLAGHAILAVSRRGKYLLLKTVLGTIIIHLGMSGHLRVVPHALTVGKHDHFDIVFVNGYTLRLTDPRRFGAVLWAPLPDPLLHPVLCQLGVEPLSAQFTAHHLQQQLNQTSRSIKLALMDQAKVVGIGNIYANEALFRARIHPASKANQLSLVRLQSLVTAIKTVLRSAIKQGGTTLKDYINSQGQPGYFGQTLQVYGRAGSACYRCGTGLQLLRLDGRSTVYCSQCQC